MRLDRPPTDRRLLLSRLTIFLPLLLVILAACGNGSGGGSAY